jgi:hypothetical protein
MRWLILIIVVGIVGYFFYLRRNPKSNYSEEQLELMKSLVDEKLEQNKIKKQKIIDKASVEGKTVPLSGLLDKLEKSKEEHQGDEEYIAELDRQIKELKDKYGAEVPIGDLYKLVTDYEDEYGPV